MANPTQTVIALLRGINVGGKNRLPMADLRSIAHNLGFANATTYLQSGNLVLPDVRLGSDGVSAALADAIRRIAGLDIPIITRTASEWARLVANNPFPGANIDGTKLHVVFLKQPATKLIRCFDAEPYKPEELAVTESEVYLLLPKGLGRSKLATALARIDNANAGTTRNWNTVTALSERIAAERT